MQHLTPCIGEERKVDNLYDVKRGNKLNFQIADALSVHITIGG